MNERFPNLNLPAAKLKLSRENETVYVWDNLRRKELVLSPEEWVRQHIVHYLLNELNYPKAMIALEGGHAQAKTIRRTDILVYKDSKAWLLIECKAPYVKINQETFDQANRYNIHYKAPYLMVSNGLEHFYGAIDHLNKKFNFIPELPNYNEDR